MHKTRQNINSKKTFYATFQAGNHQTSFFLYECVSIEAFRSRLLHHTQRWSKCRIGSIFKDPN